MTKRTKQHPSFKDKNTLDEILEGMYNAVGRSGFPVELIQDESRNISATYSDVWKAGTLGNYTQEALTQSEIGRLNAYLNTQGLV